MHAKKYIKITLSISYVDSLPDELLHFRSRRSQMFFKIGVPENFAIFTGKHLCWSLFLIKRDATQVFCYEFCEILKNTFFYRTRLVAASDTYAF